MAGEPVPGAARGGDSRDQAGRGPVRPALVIGYGNPLRGDDGAGFAAAELLAGKLREGEREAPDAGPGYSVRACHQLTYDLAEAVSRADPVVFIDADPRVPAGELSEREAGEDPSPPPLSHHLTPSALLAVTRAVYGEAPRGIILSVGAASFDSPGLSPAVAEALPRLVEVARAIAEARGRRRANGDPGEG